jgi:hypothetical protein
MDMTHAERERGFVLSAMEDGDLVAEVRKARDDGRSQETGPADHENSHRWQQHNRSVNGSDIILGGER